MNIQPGDLLLFKVSKSSNWLDKAIGWGQRVIHQAPTDAAYCHVGIVGPDAGHFYESHWPKIHNAELDFKKIQKDVVVEVYRVVNVTPGEVAKVMQYCQEKVGEWYPVISILTFGMVTIGFNPYCSMLAWRAYLHANRILCEDQRMVSPDDIAGSSQVIRIR